MSARQLRAFDLDLESRAARGVVTSNFVGVGASLSDCLQPLLALCFFDLDVSSGLDSLERFDGNAAFSSNSGLELLDDLDVSSGLNGLHGLFARTIGCLRAVSQLL